MKKLLLLTAALTAMLSATAQTVKFASSTPAPGQPLSFEYNPVGGTLDKLADVKCQAIMLMGKQFKSAKVELTKEGGIYKGTMPTADSISLVMLSFNAGDTRDKNPNGYFTAFYKNGVADAKTHLVLADYYQTISVNYMGWKRNSEKAIKEYEEAFKMDPKLKATNESAYLGAQYDVDKEKGLAMINAFMKKLNTSKAKSETDLVTIMGLYTKLKKKSQADSVKTIILKSFPTGNFAYSDRANGVFRENDAVKKEEKFNALVKDFKLDAKKKADMAKISSFYSNLASAYGSAKNNQKFEFYTDKIEDKNALAGTYNSYAWANAEKKENLEFSAKISKKSLALVEAAKNDPKPGYFDTQEEYVKSLDGSYAMYADTYALLLAHLNNYAEALKYQEKAVTMNGFTNPEMNDRYVNFLAKNGLNDKVVTYAEKFIKDGKGTEQMKSDLKAAYKGTTPFDTYYDALEREAIAAERAKFVKEMIDMPAPKFTLANLKGETVSLDQLKGKVVIVDYWATWCGPCIASFPGMQKAVDKYKSDPNVVFLFVNTWQTEENREKVVKDYIASTPYTFNVLLDTKNKQDPNKFDVIEQYHVEGIPTKFILDGNGNIRFKKVGFGGTAEGTVKELDIMIALAKTGKETSK